LIQHTRFQPNKASLLLKINTTESTSSLLRIWQDSSEVKITPDTFAAVADENPGVPLTAEQVTALAAALDTNSEGQVRTCTLSETPIAEPGSDFSCFADHCR
jgi:hypothetical protein